MLYLGAVIEGTANTRFFWPCTSDFVKSIEAILLIVFYWVVYAESETSRFVIIQMVYLTHLFDVFQSESCGDIESQSVSEHLNIRKTNPLEWDRLYGIHFGIRGIVATVEVIDDVRTSRDMAHTERRAE